MRAATGDSHYGKVSDLQMVREMSDIAGPVDEASSWLECAQPISRSVRAHEPDARLANRHLFERQFQARPGRPMESEYGRAIGLAELQPTEIAAVREDGHMRVTHVTTLGLPSWSVPGRSAVPRSSRRTPGLSARQSGALGSGHDSLRPVDRVGCLDELDPALALAGS